MNTNKTTNFFKFMDGSNDSTTSFSGRLIAKSDDRAATVMAQIQGNEELQELAATAFASSNAPALIDLIAAVFDDETLEEDSIDLLNGASTDSLNKMLKSRQSDRCKTFAKGKVSEFVYQACSNYISAMYAELVIRTAMKKPYSGSVQSDFDETDLDAVARRIKSLQSKKCNLGKLLRAGDTSVQAQYDETVAEIDRLNDLRGSSSGKSKAVITKDALVKSLMGLSDAALDALPAEQAEALRALKASLNK